MKRIFSIIIVLAVALGALQAQNVITVSDVSLHEGETATVSVELTNEIEFSAFQMDLKLPEGFSIATTINEDDEEVLDIALSDARKKSTHSVSYNILNSGTIRIASFSSTNATYKGTSGEILQIRIVAREDAEAGAYATTLSNILFTTPDAVDYNLGTVSFDVIYSVNEPIMPTNKISASEVSLQLDESAFLSVELANETEFSAFQMDLLLPAGLYIATTTNEDGEEVLDITLGENRKKSTHVLAYNMLSNGAIRIASYSNTNATYKGTSGEIVRFRIAATEDIVEGEYTALLSNVIFTTPDPVVDYRLNSLDVQILCSAPEGGDVDQPEQLEHNVTIHASQYGRCLWNGMLTEPHDSCALSGVVAHDNAITLYFIPFEGYTASSMKRNGEVVTIYNNIYEEKAMQDVAFTDVNYTTLVDTLVVTETIVDTMVVKETVVDTLVVKVPTADTVEVKVPVVDTLIVTETITDTLVVTETIVDTMVVKETVVDTLVVTETIVDTLVVTETIVDTLIMTDTVFIAQIEELPMPIITYDSCIVSITCEQEDVTILYAINGNPLGGSIYTAPFKVTENMVVSAIAIRSSDKAELNIIADGMVQSQRHIISRRYYMENGVEVSVPAEGVTIVVTEYEDGTTRVYKIVKR